MIMELNQVILCLVLFCGIKLTWCSNSRTSSQNTGVIPIARCRVRCLTKFLETTVNDDECRRNEQCRLCWSMCENLFNDYDIWIETCSRKPICTSGCKVACKFRARAPPVCRCEKACTDGPDWTCGVVGWCDGKLTVLLWRIVVQGPIILAVDAGGGYQVIKNWKFADPPAVAPEQKLRKAWMAWSAPIPINSIPDTESGSRDHLVYVLLARDLTKRTEKAWQQTLQTASTGAVLDLNFIPYHPEFWLLAVGRDGTMATIRFNASVSEDAPYTQDRIEFPGKFESRYGNGAVIELDNDSTLNLTMDLQVRNGYVYPIIMWTNPPVVPRRGRTYLMYRIDYYLQNCRCDLPSDHFSEVEKVEVNKKAKFKLSDIAFNAEYLVEVSLIADDKWHGKMTFWTPDCSDVKPLDQTQCLEDISNKPKLVTKPVTTTQKVKLDPVMFPDLNSLSTERPPDLNDSLLVSTERPTEFKNQTSDNMVVSSKSKTNSRVPLDWNITVIDKQYDPTSHHVFVHVRWQLPFSHVGIRQMLVWHNLDHSEQVDAGRTGHVAKADESTSAILKLKPNNEYSLRVEAWYNNSRGVENVEISKTLLIYTNSTEEMSEVQASRQQMTDHEKDILNGIILGVTVVSSIIIFGIIVLFIYKKRQSFRDIIITKTAVAKSNSYKSNVGCKVDYSNQILLTSDDWEVDCRNLKFASHIGQGAFGKVVTGFYEDQRVAIKLVRDSAPISYKEDLLAEINLMKRIGSHPNIVSMIGACTLTEPIALIMEYVPYGNLQNFLKKCRLEGELNVQNGRCRELNYSFMDEHGGLNEGIVTPADMLSFARQVAMAMEYLVEKKYVHRDLAARNVLLGYDKIIKVCDFGLSRDIYNDNQYKKLTNGKLPLKWMAIESLRDRVFTTHSDVWSFGILLWEIVTMGASPYPNIALADLYYVLSNHYRMEKPSNCSDELYIIMRQCWYDDPKDRPSFTDLRVQLEMLLTRDRNYLELDNINVPLSTPETSSGSPVSDDTASLLAAQALQPQRKLSKDELTVNVCIHEKSVDRLLKRKGDLDSHNITIL